MKIETYILEKKRQLIEKLEQEYNPDIEIELRVYTELIEKFIQTSHVAALVYGLDKIYGVL
jgi:hypothetical protein